MYWGGTVEEGDLESTIEVIKNASYGDCVFPLCIIRPFCSGAGGNPRTAHPARFEKLELDAVKSARFEKLGLIAVKSTRSESMAWAQHATQGVARFLRYTSTICGHRAFAFFMGPNARDRRLCV